LIAEGQCGAGFQVGIAMPQPGRAVNYFPNRLMA
jgi:hypothetical protein